MDGRVTPTRCIFCGHRDNPECERCVATMANRARVAELEHLVYRALLRSPESSAAQTALSELAALASGAR